MKTAISIPDPIFLAAEEMAKRLELSRSELYARAVDEFVESRRRRGVKERLNKVYSRESSKLDPVVERMQAVSVLREDW